MTIANEIKLAATNAAGQTLWTAPAESVFAGEYELVVKNTGPDAARVGGADVTSAVGFPLSSGEEVTISHLSPGDTVLVSSQGATGSTVYGLVVTPTGA